MGLPPPILVDDADALADLVSTLADQSIVAVDTESNSMHAHTERVCLVQLTAGETDYIVDPLAVNIAPLGELFADPRREKILHAAEYDVMCLRRDYGFEFHNLFDTMLTARILGWPRHALSAILADTYGVTLDKKMQRHDWGQRPLPERAIEYARFDTHYLEALRARQLELLEEAGRVREARAAFARVAKATATPKVWDPEGFWKVKGASKLDPQGASVLRALYGFRERLAQKLDRPLFKIMGDAVLVALAERAPRGRRALQDVRGISPHLVRRNGAALLACIAEALEAEPPVRPPRPPRPARTPADDRFDKLKGWRKQTAEGRGVETDVIVSRQALEAIAAGDPRDLDALRALGALDEWQFETYGPAILVLLGADAG